MITSVFLFAINYFFVKLISNEFSLVPDIFQDSLKFRCEKGFAECLMPPLQKISLM